MRVGGILFSILIFLGLGQSADAFIPPEAIKVTKQGKNRQPVFVSDNSFIFVSEGRRFQKDPQLFFYDLEQGKEKRITHQRGQLSNGFYLDETGHIFYTSTTDEEKETPYALKSVMDRYPASVKNDSFFQVEFAPQEVYQSRIDGTEVQRITEYSGFDGFPAYYPKKKQLYFSRWENGKISIYAQSMQGKLAPWKVSKTSGHDIGLKISPEGNEFVWSRFSPDFKSSQILSASADLRNPSYVTLESGVNWAPTWHPNGKSILYSARTSGMRDYDLFEVSANGDCKRQITGYAGDEFFPAVSPDGKTILFTSTMSGGEQIYKVPYPGSLSCPQPQ